MRLPRITGAQIVREAREWIGTPFHAGAGLKGIGADCIGLVIGTFAALGVPVERPEHGTEGDRIELLTREIARYCDPAEGPIQAGDLLLFRGRLILHHSALATGEGTMVHAYDSKTFDRVVEQRITPEWEGRLHARYRYRRLR